MMKHISIDGLLKDEKVNFIKMDIEGAEVNAYMVHQTHCG